jgi:hypothetical protein
MSNAFGESPPVYSNTGSGATSHSTPYPTNTSLMPMPGVGGVGISTGHSTSYSYPYGYPPTQIPQEVYRDSIQTAVLDKVRIRLDETLQIGNAEINSLRKTEEDLNAGEKKLHGLIRDVQQQQVQAQVHIFLFFLLFSVDCHFFFQNYLTNIRAKTNEMLDATHKTPSSRRENTVKDDALIIPTPVYKQYSSSLFSLTFNLFLFSFVKTFTSLC